MPAEGHPMPRHHRPAYRAVLRYSRAFHTYLSMLATIGIAFLAATGFMLNHPAWFGLDNARTTEVTFKMPDDLLSSKDKLALVEYLRAHGVRGAVQQFDWPGDGEPFHVAFKAPGSQCDADIALPGGETHLTIETRGINGLLTRLHTAKDAGPVWRFVLDATSILLLIVCITGLVLWQSLPRRRNIGALAFIVSAVAVVVVYALWVP
jgi:uncharacterized protein